MNFTQIGLQVPTLLLPRTSTDLTKWAVVACDQYTSQPDYWARVEALVGDAPSTLRLILPEVDLGATDEAQRIAAIHDLEDQSIPFLAVFTNERLQVLHGRGFDR